MILEYGVYIYRHKLLKALIVFSLYAEEPNGIMSMSLHPQLEDVYSTEQKVSYYTMSCINDCSAHQY